MNNIKSKRYPASFVLSMLLTLVVFSFYTLLSVHIAQADEQFENPPFVGVVTRITLGKATLVVKNSEGKRQSIFFTEQTQFKGVLLAEEIKVKQKVKVWYVLEDDKFKALKIEVMPELGC